MDWVIATVAVALAVANVVLAVLLLRRRRLALPNPAVAPTSPAQQLAARRQLSEKASEASPRGVTISPDGGMRALGGGAPLLEVPDDDPTALLDCILVSAAARSDKGLSRASNQDAVLAQPSDVFAIADGMGGYEGGDVSSRLALDTLREALEGAGRGERPVPAVPARGAELVHGIWMANEAVRRQAGAAISGTTLVAARFSPNKRHVYIANVGDSRCYRIRDGRATLLTSDHTAGGQGPGSRDLVRAVGAKDALEVDLIVDHTRPGDHYLLCSDGLWGAVPEQRLVSIVRSCTDLERTVRQLVAEAVCAGTRDDVSAVLVRVDEAQQELTSPSATTGARLLSAVGTGA